MSSPAAVRLIRRVYFSSGHRYWIPTLSEGENRAIFGTWASPYNHGHNYVLDVATEGLVDLGTGMVVNIKDIDEVLQDRIVGQFDGRSINDEVPYFNDHAASLENIIRYIRSELDGLPPQAKLVGLRLEEMPTLWANLDHIHEEDWKMTLTRTYEFAASHRLHVPGLSDEENLELFGKCNNPAGHGHNYIVEVTVSGQPDERTGMIIDLEELDAVVEREVIERYDHKNLNEDLPEFKNSATTSERVVQEVWFRLVDKVPGNLVRVRLHETARNIFEVSAPYISNFLSSGEARGL
ncbi:MAG: 6-carboxytetrahydropterin synthase [Fimbriimonadaceae bacterium]